MENKFKLRISRIFHNSCKSCDDVSVRRGVVEKFPFLSRSQSVPAVVPQQKPHPQPSTCKPRTPPSLHVNNTCIVSSKEVHSFVPLTHKNRASPRKSKSKPKSESPVSPVKHFAYSPFYDCSGMQYYAVEDGHRKKKKKNKAKMLPSFDDYDFFCGDDEKEEDDDERTTGTLFSSKSLSSSESSENHRGMTRNGRRRTELDNSHVGVRGSFAVVKKSRDPYGDFRKSMVEMITERGIFREEELEKLLLCFLSLNSSHHHKIIVQAFNEIWDALH